MHDKYTSSVINSSQENMWKPFFTKITLVTLTFYLVNRKSIEALTKANKPVNYESSLINRSQENERKPILFFTNETLVTLTFNNVNP